MDLLPFSGQTAGAVILSPALMQIGEHQHRQVLRHAVMRLAVFQPAHGWGQILYGNSSQSSSLWLGKVVPQAQVKLPVKVPHLLFTPAEGQGLLANVHRKIVNPVAGGLPSIAAHDMFQKGAEQPQPVGGSGKGQRLILIIDHLPFRLYRTYRPLSKIQVGHHTVGHHKIQHIVQHIKIIVAFGQIL